MRSALKQQAAAWLAQGLPACWIEVREVRGSVPREAGTRMVVSTDAALGTIGGGHLEWQAIQRARELLPALHLPALHLQAASEAAPNSFVDWPVTLGPSLGQCCGGALTLRFSLLTAPSLADWPAEPPRFHLQLYGAGHVGRAIMKMLAELPCAARWIDEREAEFPAEPSPPHVRRVLSESPEAEVATAPPGAFHLVMTHRHDLDFAIARAVLLRGEFGFLGVIGSATKAARFRQRLQQQGLGADSLGRLQCPIGLPALRGKAPSVIAVSVLAQLLLASNSGQ